MEWYKDLSVNQKLTYPSLLLAGVVIFASSTGILGLKALNNSAIRSHSNTYRANLNCCKLIKSFTKRKSPNVA